MGFGSRNGWRSHWYVLELKRLQNLGVQHWDQRKQNSSNQWEPRRLIDNKYKVVHHVSCPIVEHLHVRVWDGESRGIVIFLVLVGMFRLGSVLCWIAPGHGVFYIPLSPKRGFVVQFLRVRWWLG